MTFLILHGYKQMHSHNFPQTHFLLMAEMVRSGKPFIAEKLMSETARLTSNMFGGVRRHLDLSKKNILNFFQISWIFTWKHRCIHG